MPKYTPTQDLPYLFCGENVTVLIMKRFLESLLTQVYFK